ncbi:MULTISPECIES: competence type IV pilus minor pilin ComGD [Rummeliibacillus]|jgi:competence protein ComGD|uniref:competence type IV pilus minor pilin ComGD n=1 Tax=Rummeliibacillus TaxID=648802 RepID=UPI0011B7EBB9|nr:MULTISPECIES: competence type IV pilus minor pilin ComGD [Rummeliibacillus]MBO2535008.1 prepilin-type N-terminal cleavage/methylation domain-containing protein [Rummeliibacillus suwonensis]
MVKWKFQVKQFQINQKGFTLIEMLLVLTITMITCTMGITVGKKYMDQQLENRFMEQLKADIEMTQALSFQYQSPASLYIYQSLREIHIYSTGYSMEKPLLIRKYPANIVFQSGNMDHVIFTENQTVNRAGTIGFKVNGKRKNLIVYLGEGRVKIDQ